MSDMHPNRIDALAELIDAMRRDQINDGFGLFTIGSDDKISNTDAEVIVKALKTYAKARRWGAALGAEAANGQETPPP